MVSSLSPTGRRRAPKGPTKTDRPFGEPQSSEEPYKVELRRARERGRGREAIHPLQIPWRGWYDVVWRTYREMQSDRLLSISGGVSFFVLLAIFPAITALVSAYGLLFSPSTITNNLSILNEFPNLAASLVQPWPRLGNPERHESRSEQRKGNAWKQIRTSSQVSVTEGLATGRRDVALQEANYDQHKTRRGGTAVQRTIERQPWTKGGSAEERKKRILISPTWARNPARPRKNRAELLKKSHRRRDYTNCDLRGIVRCDTRHLWVDETSRRFCGKHSFAAAFVANTVPAKDRGCADVISCLPSERPTYLNTSVQGSEAMRLMRAAGSFLASLLRRTSPAPIFLATTRRKMARMSVRLVTLHQDSFRPKQF